jgi:hypothetical protein
MIPAINQEIGDFLLSENIAFVPKEVPEYPEELTPQMLKIVLKITQKNNCPAETKSKVKSLLGRIIPTASSIVSIENPVSNSTLIGFLIGSQICNLHALVEDY